MSILQRVWKWVQAEELKNSVVLQLRDVIRQREATHTTRSLLDVFWRCRCNQSKMSMRLGILCKRMAQIRKLRNCPLKLQVITLQSQFVIWSTVG